MKVVAVGDIALDTFLELKPSDVALHCNLDTHRCEICFGYAQKIPVAGMTRAAGGNAANAAVGLARLSHAVWLYSQVGDDETGHQLLAQLADEQVDLSSVAAAVKEATNCSTIISYRGERTIFSYHAPRRYHIDLPTVVPDLLYLTSMGEGWPSLYRRVVAAYPTVPLVIQPGTLQIRSGTALRPWLRRAAALILNREEAQTLLGAPAAKDPADPKGLLHALLDLGPKEVVVTDGQQGAYLSDGQEFLRVGTVATGVRRELTGVGDAFAVGWVHGRLAGGRSLPAAGRLGAVNAASVMQQIGAQAGLLPAGELIRQFKQQSLAIETL